MKLPEIVCECGCVVESEEYASEPKQEGAPMATTYEICLRRCERCGIGYSNAQTEDVSKLTQILRDPFSGIPPRIAEGAMLTLENAFNVQNRPSKKGKFSSMNSEDHVTWVIFRHLQLEGRLAAALASCEALPSLEAGGVEPKLLLWGAPVPKGDSAGAAVQDGLEKVCDAVGENKKSRSEPDVILDCGRAGVVFIEVKLRSANDLKPADYRGRDGTNKWDKYLRGTRAFRNGEAARESGFYELTRNWRLAWDLAGDRPMCLVNLGPATLNEGEPGAKLNRWVQTLSQDERHRFRSVVWPRLLEAMQSTPPWLADYLRHRGVHWAFWVAD